jgi:hypothetical protein
MKAAILAGLLTGVGIASYTVWDKYAVSVVQVSPILLDLLANPVQAVLLTRKLRCTEAAGEDHHRPWSDFVIEG